MLKVVKPRADVAPAKKKPKTELKEAVVVSAEEELVLTARGAYRNLHKSWYLFAKAIYDLREKNAATPLGHDSFKELCASEFPDLSFGTISKYCKVIESWGMALEQRMLKSPDQPLPSYDACYELAIHEEKVPKEELPKLRKSVLERELMRSEVRDRLRDFRRKVIPEKMSRKLDREIEASEAKAKADSAATAENLAVVKDAKTETAAEQLLARAKLLFENLPALTASLTETTPTVIALAEFLRDHSGSFTKNIDKFLTKVEKISTNEG